MLCFPIERFLLRRSMSVATLYVCGRYDRGVGWHFRHVIESKARFHRHTCTRLQQRRRMVLLKLSCASFRMLCGRGCCLPNSLFKVSWKALSFLSRGVLARILSTSYKFGGISCVSSPSSSSTVSFPPSPAASPGRNRADAIAAVLPVSLPLRLLSSPSASWPRVPSFSAAGPARSCLL